MALKFSFREGPTTTKIYSGFAQWKHPRELLPNQQVVVVWSEGSYELFVIESNHGVDELRRFHRDLGHEIQITILDQAP